MEDAEWRLCHWHLQAELEWRITLTQHSPYSLLESGNCSSFWDSINTRSKTQWSSVAWVISHRGDFTPLSTSLPGEHGTFLGTSHSPCDPEALHCCACCSSFPHLFVLSWYWRILTDRDSDRKSCFNNATAKTLFQNDERKLLPLMFYFQKSKTMFCFVFQWKLVSEVSLP